MGQGTFRMLLNAQNLDLVFSGLKTVFNEAFAAAPSKWADVAMTVQSTSADEQYTWLGEFPQMREWIGPRHVKSLSAHGFKIVNRKFESTISIKREHIEDDRIGIFKPALTEMGRASAQHPDELVFGLLSQGFATLCYDGQNFFDAEHPVKDSDGQDVLVSNMQDGAGPAWYLMDTTRGVKPMVWQTRTPYEFTALTRSEDEAVFRNDEYLYGVRARANAGFGLWQLAFGSKAALTPENYAAARSAMMRFTADGGKKLGIMPSLLVVPPELESAALALLNTELGANGESNIWKGTAQMTLTPYL